MPPALLHQARAEGGGPEQAQHPLHRVPKEDAHIPQDRNQKLPGPPEDMSRTAGVATVVAAPRLQMSHRDAPEPGERGPGQKENSPRGGEEKLPGLHHLQERHVAAQDVQVGEALPGSCQGYALPHRL